MVTREFLDSDRVNFLIWRYLLEGNYRETALKFQKEWHVREPHRDLPFAGHVKGHALVSVINRGLIYYALEREYARNQMSESAAAQAEVLHNGIFGPLNTPPTAKVEHAESIETGEEINDLRKRAQHTHLPNGSPAKRPRLSNGYENGLRETATGTEASMEIDQPFETPQRQTAEQDNSQNNTNNHSNNNQAYPSPMERDQTASPVVRTDGPEQGTQIEKVEQLYPGTIFLKLVDDGESGSEGPTGNAITSSDPVTSHAAQSSPTSATAPTQSQTETSMNGTALADNKAPILLQCEWNPKDSTSLAAAGTDALARVWTIARTAAGETIGDQGPPRALSLLVPETPKTTTVTALAWTSDGGIIAVANDNGSGLRGAINLWTVDGSHVETFEVSEPPVVKLLWNSTNTSLLALSPDQKGARLTVYDTATGSSIPYLVPDVDMLSYPLDADWASDVDVLLCGGNTFLSLHRSDSSIELIREFDIREEDNFTQVAFDGRAKLAATASDKGILDLWDESGQRRSITAHQGAITTMAWQPMPAGEVLGEERLIATGGEDCAILVWNARMPESKPTCFLTMDSPIVKVAFTPDGAFLAGATSSQVLIWRVGSYSMPRASWSTQDVPGWQSPKAVPDSDEEDEYCLCWDSSGQKLAYGSNSRLAVINFSR